MTDQEQIEHMQAQLQIAQEQCREDRMARLDAEQERDALAAHVERYHAAYVKLTNTELTGDVDTGEVMHLVRGRLMDEFDVIADDTPTTSLARLKAECKAEALHELLMHPRLDGSAIRQRAVDLRDDYRRQAEED